MGFPIEFARSRTVQRPDLCGEPVAEPGRPDSWVDLPAGAGAPRLADPRAPGPEGSWDDFSVYSFPEVGGDFLGFQLVDELGRGAFGRVYLARQDDLAGRLVALKISTEVKAESHYLARLQHTHIVPVYSFHRSGPLQAVCMPYFGSATLADVLRDLHQRQAPPQSGKGLVSTIQDRAGRTKNSLEKASRRVQARSASAGGNDPLACASGLCAVAPSALLAEAVERPSEVLPHLEAAPTLRMLEGLSHVDAVLWIGERLADGLAHAHERGILHRDLKPANILLTDEGQPMLLDFNLSADAHASASRARIGGTLPYMAPEHLASFAGLPAPFPIGGNARATVDARSDVFALGMILFELLTGVAPFEPPTPNVPDAIPRMIANRIGRTPRVRTRNRGVSPAVESIIRHCLEPDPARRYQSARQLAEDIERQRSDLPLAHAPEASLREKLSKYLRRNRRRAVLTAGMLSVLLILGLTGRLAARNQSLGRMEAAATWSLFREESNEARLLLAARPRDVEQRRAGIRLAHQALARYDVLGRASWTQQPMVQRLSADERRLLQYAVGELALLAAGSDDAERKPLLLERAGDCFAPEEAPRALYLARAEQARKRSDQEEAEACREKARTCPVVSATDHYLLARELLDGGESVKAIEHLRQAVQIDPKHFAAWYLLGNCFMDGAVGMELDDHEAIHCLSISITLQPGFYGSYFNRGLVHQHKAELAEAKPKPAEAMAEYAEAEADFNRALELRPSFAVALLHRGLVRERQNNLNEALADFTRAIDLGDVPSRVWFARASVYRRLGNKRAAAKDDREGMLHPPRDEESYLRRGVLRAAMDPREALADFQEAVRLNPCSLRGLYNQALIFADKLGQPKEAIRALDEAVRRHPLRVEPLASRAVLRARLGMRKEAHADGAAARKLAPQSIQVLYQTACIHALTSRTHADDRDEAFRLLKQALSGGFGHSLLESDRDLEPLRADPRFQKLVKAVRDLTTW
jgi:serine/threonine protein kinase/Flp pilus assembly protein TadD